VLLLAPAAAFVATGAWAMWETGRLTWWWWTLPISWAAAYALARTARAGRESWVGPAPPAPPHWTRRDEQAALLIAGRQAKVEQVSPERLTDPQFYFQTARELSHEIARHYHPGAGDPVSSLTVPEILTAAELALQDVSQWMRQYVPGSHLLTVAQWRMLARAPQWFRTAGNIAWAVSILVNPARLGRYVVSKLTLDSASRQVQANVLAAFYVVFVRRVGFYAIEMNSGRLRGGAAHYRQTMARLEASPANSIAAPSAAAAPASQPPMPPPEVTLVLVGQVKAGKSSLANSLLGSRQAATDLLPQTSSVRRYQLALPAATDRLVLLDTPGYADAGATAQQLQEVQQALAQADLVLLVMDVTSPARQADRQMLDQLQAHLAAHPHRKTPPVVGVLTHIDALSPALEWSPPYNWESPANAKETTIAAAVAYNRQLFGRLLSAIVPVCSDESRQRVYGVDEWLLPVITALLDEARAASLVRALHAQLDEGQWRRVCQQLVSAGKAVLLACLEAGLLEDSLPPRPRDRSPRIR